MTLRRALGIDLGDRRVGIAMATGNVATPLQVVSRSKSTALDHEQIFAIATEWEVDVLVVGVPYSLDGSVGPAAEKVLAEIDQLRARTNLPVEIYDERFTTVTAQQRLREGGVSNRQSKNLVDAMAATVLLQAWLDNHQ
ncbi:MAG: Holliday junction resolvase RuvX [Actinomycetota bacterium]